MNSLQKAKLAVISGITICVASLGFIAMSGAQANSSVNAESLPLRAYGLAKQDECTASGPGKSCLQKTAAIADNKVWTNLPAIAIVSSDSATTQLIKGDRVLVATQ